MYPPAVEGTLYGGYSGCVLKEFGKRPLWRALERKYRQQIRFTFTDGHAAFTKVIDFVEMADGTGKIGLTIVSRQRDGTRAITKNQSFRVSTTDIARINSLGEQSGVWSFETGSWDGDELYMHCETLDMERIDASGYRHSSVNVSCNQPAKLMPFVNFVTDLVKLRPSSDSSSY